MYSRNTGGVLRPWRLGMLYALLVIIVMVRYDKFTDFLIRWPCSSACCNCPSCTFGV